jgi:hypothetical protein
MIDFFHKHGYLLLKGVYGNQEVSHIDTTVNILGYEQDRPNYVKKIYTGNYLSHIRNVVNNNSDIGILTQDKRILKVLKDIYNQEPLLLRDQIRIIQPNAEPTEIKQDMTSGLLRYTGMPITSLVVLDDNFVFDLWYSDTGRVTTLMSDPFNPLDKKDVDSESLTSITCNAGDVLLYDGFIPHRMGKNTKNKYLTVLEFTYNPSSDGDNYLLVNS